VTTERQGRRPPRKPPKRARELRYKSNPDWDPSRSYGIGSIRVIDDEDDGGGVSDREPRKPLQPSDLG
jgi:hypothetical protein